MYVKYIEWVAVVMLQLELCGITLIVPIPVELFPFSFPLIPSPTTHFLSYFPYITISIFSHFYSHIVSNNYI